MELTINLSEVQKLDLKLSDFIVMKLVQANDLITCSEIAKQTNITPLSAGNILRRLEKKSLLMFGEKVGNKVRKLVKTTDNE